MNQPFDRRAFLKTLAAVGALPLSRYLPGTESSVAHASDRGAGKRVVVLGAGLAAYMFDTEALEFASHGHRRVAAMRKLFRRLLPGIQGQIVAGAHKAWQEDPWAGGGWGWTQPGELEWMFPPPCASPRGACTSPASTRLCWIAWMNGALESAERAVHEILAADVTAREARA